MIDKPLDIDGLADYLGVSPRWVKAQVAARAIPFTKLPGGRMVRFTAEDVAEILAAGKKEPETAPTRTEVVRRLEAVSTRRRKVG